MTVFFFFFSILCPVRRTKNSTIMATNVVILCVALVPVCVVAFGTYSGNTKVSAFTLTGYIVRTIILLNIILLSDVYRIHTVCGRSVSRKYGRVLAPRPSWTLRWSEPSRLIGVRGRRQQTNLEEPNENMEIARAPAGLSTSKRVPPYAYYVPNITYIRQSPHWDISKYYRLGTGENVIVIIGRNRYGLIILFRWLGYKGPTVRAYRRLFDDLFI